MVNQVTAPFILTTAHIWATVGHCVQLWAQLAPYGPEAISPSLSLVDY